MFSFNVLLILFLYVYIYAEIFTSFIFNTLFKNTKFFSNQLTKFVKPYLFNSLLIYTIINFLIFFFLTFKLNETNVLISFIILFIFIYKYINHYFENFINFLNFNVILFILFLFFINNFITLYLYIELYALLFYFFFLNINLKIKQTYLIQYKNSILLYLFNNFLTSILYLFSINNLIYVYGTLNFSELLFFNHISINWISYILVLSFVIKLSLPGYHFLKIEIYKYLSATNVIYFSTISLYINFIFLTFVFNQNIVFFILNSYRIHSFLLLCALFFFIHKLKISNFQEFIAYSGFATSNLIILNFLV